MKIISGEKGKARVTYRSGASVFAGEGARRGGPGRPGSLNTGPPVKPAAPASPSA